MPRLQIPERVSTAEIAVAAMPAPAELRIDADIARHAVRGYRLRHDREQLCERAADQRGRRRIRIAVAEALFRPPAATWTTTIVVLVPGQRAVGFRRIRRDAIVR